MALGATKRLKRLKSSSSMTFGIHPVCSNNNSSGNNSSNNNSNNSCHNNSNSSFFLIILLMINIIIVFWIGIDGCCCCWRPPTSHLPLPTPHPPPPSVAEWDEWMTDETRDGATAPAQYRSTSDWRPSRIHRQSIEKKMESFAFFLFKFIHSFILLFRGKMQDVVPEAPARWQPSGRWRDKAETMIPPPSPIPPAFRLSNDQSNKRARREEEKQKEKEDMMIQMKMMMNPSSLYSIDNRPVLTPIDRWVLPLYLLIRPNSISGSSFPYFLRFLPPSPPHSHLHPYIYI